MRLMTAEIIDRIIAIAIAATVLVGCAAVIPPVQPPATAEPMPLRIKNNVSRAELEQLKAAAAKHLKDPQSATFDGLTVRVRDGDGGKQYRVLCGLINAKNGFGGFTGAKPFAYFPDDPPPDLFILGEGDQLRQMASAGLVRICGF